MFYQHLSYGDLSLKKGTRQKALFGIRTINLEISDKVPMQMQQVNRRSKETNVDNKKSPPLQPTLAFLVGKANLWPQIFFRKTKKGLDPGNIKGGQP